MNHSEEKFLYLTKLLNTVSSDKINNGSEFDGVLDKIIQMTRKEILAQHPYKIWQGKDGRWRTYLCDKDGRRVLIAKSTLKKIEDSIIEHYEKQVPTISTVFDEWITFKLQTHSIAKNTADRYQNDFDTHFRNSNLINKPISEIDNDDIENFIDELLKHNMTQKAFSNARTVLFGIFRYAKKRKLTKMSITSVVNDIEISRKSFKRTVKRREEQIFSMEEIKAILDYCDQNPTIPNLAVSVATRTGVRIGELATIKFPDVGQNRVHIQRTEIKYKDENGKTVWEVREMPKTEAGDRFVYVTDKVMETIHQLRLLPHETDYIFEVNGHWMQSFYYDRALRRICKALHIPVRSMHKLRRTYGTTLINSHLEDSLVTSQMGHTSIDTTKKYYYYDNIEDDYKKDLIMQAVSF